MIELFLSISIALVLIAFFAGIFLQKRKDFNKHVKLNENIESILESSKKQAEAILLEAELKAKELIIKGRQELDREERDLKKELHGQEKRLIAKEEWVDKKREQLDQKEEDLNRKVQSYESKMKDLERMRKECEELTAKQLNEIEKVASMTRNEAKELLINQMLDEARLDSAKLIKEIEEEAKRNAERRAQSIIASTIQRIASDYVGEIAVTVVNLPNDDMKGRIIGREGRNIRTFENITGVDIIVDDTPEAVILSSYDPYRRAIAGLTLEKLITDGRIHPGRIEEVYQKSKTEIEKEILDAGEEAIFELGIGNIDTNLIKMLGRLKYRTSYGQNVLMHSIEVAKIAGLMAEELGINSKMAKRAGLLHDIGKAIDQESEGTHIDIGYELCKKYGESEIVLNSIRSHHGEEDFKYIESVLVQASDAISASRPGARREVLESYIKRLETLESIASSFEGVSKSFAIQAGREVRIIVEPEKISDDMAICLSREISKKIEQELTYPGQIKVTVIRESRAVEYAK
jgi:ribonuclease Y